MAQAESVDGLPNSLIVCGLDSDRSEGHWNKVESRNKAKRMKNDAGSMTNASGSSADGNSVMDMEEENYANRTDNKSTHLDGAERVEPKKKEDE